MIKNMIRKINENAKKHQAILDEIEKREKISVAIQCPRCHSKNTQFIENDKKKFSVGKAVAGTVLTGGVGSLAGFAGKKGKENIWKCSECGTVFKK